MTVGDEIYIENASTKKCNGDVVVNTTFISKIQVLSIFCLIPVANSWNMNRAHRKISMTSVKTREFGKT